MFIVEDGTGREDATSYVDVAFANMYADSFFSELDYNTWSNIGEASLERLLNRATQYLDRTYVFYGQVSTSTQTLQFPRASLYDTLGNAIEGVPMVIKQATCLVAQRMMNGIALDPDTDRKTIRERIDVIDITYSQSSTMAKKFTEIDNLLQTAGIIKSNRNRTGNIRLVQG